MSKKLIHIRNFHEALRRYIVALVMGDENVICDKNSFQTETGKKVYLYTFNGHKKRFKNFKAKGEEIFEKYIDFEATGPHTLNFKAKDVEGYKGCCRFIRFDGEGVILVGIEEKGDGFIPTILVGQKINKFDGFVGCWHLAIN